MGRLAPLTSLKETDLQIPEGASTGKILREAFKRLFGSLNPYFDGINKLSSKGVTLSENLKCDVVSGAFTHGVAQQVALKALTRANGALPLGCDGQLIAHVAVQMIQGTSKTPLASVTVWFNNSAASRVNCTLILLPEGQQTTTVPTFLEAIAKSLLTTTGDMIYASSPNTPARLADVAADAYLRSGGVGIAPAYMANPFLSATSAAGQVIAIGATTIIVFGTVETDTDSGYNSGTGRYTIPTGKGGDYEITSLCQCGTTQAGGANTEVFKNAALLKYLGTIPTQTNGDTIGGTIVARLVAGDVIDIRFQNLGAGTQALTNIATVTYFIMRRLA